MRHMCIQESQQSVIWSRVTSRSSHSVGMVSGLRTNIEMARRHTSSRSTKKLNGTSTFDGTNDVIVLLDAM